MIRGDIMESPALERICVFSPSPLFTVTIEKGVDDVPDVHFHAGGQGIWVARMIAALGARAVFCGPLGGESGVVLRALIAAEPVELRATASAGANGGYVHDRRGGERESIADVPSARLSRHEVDELYGIALVAAMEAGVAVLCGPAQEDVLPAEIYRRLARDLASNGVRVVADLSRGALRELDGGVTLLKVSHEELIGAGFARSDSTDDLLAGIRALGGRAENVIVSRADRPALASIAGRIVEVVPPKLEPRDHRGAGDSMTAALAVGVRRDATVDATLRLAAAAGALNVTRHGLGTGRRADIESLSEHVEVRGL